MTSYLTDRPEDLLEDPRSPRPKKSRLVEDPSCLQRPDLDASSLTTSLLNPPQTLSASPKVPSIMANYSKYHNRTNSDPAHIHDWHVRHRSLSLTARMHANIQIPHSPTRPDMADRNTGFPEPLSPGTTSPEFSFVALGCVVLRSFNLPLLTYPRPQHHVATSRRRHFSQCLYRGAGHRHCPKPYAAALPSARAARFTPWQDHS
jgi:hypothetical protein